MSDKVHETLAQVEESLDRTELVLQRAKEALAKSRAHLRQVSMMIAVARTATR